MLKLLLVLSILSPLQQGRGTELEEQDLVHINQTLRAWLQLIEADRPYLVVDRQAGEIRLQHGRAILRNCPVVEDSLGKHWLESGKLENRIRRYRPSDPWSATASGPFDWEQNLAAEATVDCALYFSNELLIYASPVWGRPRSPALKLSGEDLQALYHATADGRALLVLPPRWNEESTDGAR